MKKKKRQKKEIELHLQQQNLRESMDNPKVQEVYIFKLFFWIINFRLRLNVSIFPKNRFEREIFWIGEQILEQQVLTVAKVVEDKLDDEIAALDKLDIDDLEALRERRLQQMKKMAEKRSRWISLGHGDYSEIPNEKEFFSVVKASERVVCHFYRDNWACKVNR